MLRTQLCIYRVRQKYLTILQNSCEGKRWRGELVIESYSSETQSISVAMERWSVEHRVFAVETIFKNNDSVLTQGIFRRHFNIHGNDSVPSRNTSSSEDIPRARCTKRKQGQWWIWNRTSGKKWQQFFPNLLQRVMHNFQKRLGEGVEKGRHLTDTIFRKWML